MGPQLLLLKSKKMKPKKVGNKEKIISLLRARLDNSGDASTLSGEYVNDDQLALLLGELEVFQLELEMQNDELSASYQLLETERAKFAGFFNRAPVGYFILDHLGLVEEANQTGADLLRISKRDILEKRFQSFIAPEMWELFYGFLHKMQTNVGKQNCEIKLLIAGDLKIYTRMEGVAIVNTFTERLQYYITVIDISESRADQQKLIGTAKRLELTLKASGTGTWTMTVATNQVFLDEFSLYLFEINPWEFDGSTRSFISFIHPDDQHLVRQSLSDATHYGGDVEMEFRIVTKSGKTKIVSAKGQQINSAGADSYFAGIVMDITEKTRLIQEAQQRDSEQQRLILAATFKAQENERNKISNALHDSVCQILYGIRLNVQNIQHSQNLNAEFQNINQLLALAITETRELSYKLSPSVLRDFGFKEGIREMIQRLSTSGFKIKSSLDASADLLHPDLQLYVFRMIQELVNNCIKHANATIVKIIVCAEGDWVNVKVSDNGKGFQVGIDESLAKGSGVRSIKNRVFLLNGTMDIDTSKSGTQVIIKFKKDSPALGLSSYS
ncbi:PAS domain S-box protein [Pedobacter hiemivivus]|uniref:histidine kinase n=2 Tax=Pedobacter hiemivivus TaxID=2530454 RepID=A0A4U1G044_9SPHI|nr:PAS domain S-box protein [Pedobacter hiemivivus]